MTIDIHICMEIIQMSKCKLFNGTRCNVLQITQDTNAAEWLRIRPKLVSLLNAYEMLNNTIIGFKWKLWLVNWVKYYDCIWLWFCVMINWFLMKRGNENEYLFYLSLSTAYKSPLLTKDLVSHGEGCAMMKDEH